MTQRAEFDATPGPVTRRTSWPAVSTVGEAELGQPLTLETGEHVELTRITKTNERWVRYRSHAGRRCCPHYTAPETRCKARGQ